MKIALPAKEPHLDAALDDRFGRCAHFIVYDSESQTFQAVPNEGENAAHGAGPLSVQTIRAAGASVIIAANVGENAERALHGAGIQIVLTEAETVREALETFLKEQDQSPLPG